jgi:hypothetical protein
MLTAILVFLSLVYLAVGVYWARMVADWGRDDNWPLRWGMTILVALLWLPLVMVGAARR